MAKRCSPNLSTRKLPRKQEYTTHGRRKHPIELDTQAVLRTLQHAADVLDGEGRELMLQDMGEYLLQSTRERAALKVSSSGEKWKALEPAYARRKKRKRPGMPILKYDVHMPGDQLSWQVSGDTLVSRHRRQIRRHSPVWRQAGMAPGPAAIRARPWLGVSHDDADELVQIVHDHLRMALDE